MDQDRDKYLKLIENNLETHDKRFLFMTLYFKEIRARVNLEGITSNVAYKMYSFIEKWGKLEKLQKILLKHF